MTMEVQIFIFFLILGMIVGSFYNVIAIRTLKKEKLSFPPSHCVNCNHRLSALDLVPVLSWTYLRGKCRYCKVPISPVYPFGELLTGFSYAIVMTTYGFTIEALVHIVLVTILAIATASDLKAMIVPNRYVVTGLILVLGLRIYIMEDIWFYLASSAGAFLLLIVIFFLSRGGMGGADIKLYALIGLAIGIGGAVASIFYAAFIATLFFAVVYLINKNKIKKKMEVPFVPFIALGVLCTYFLPFFNF